MSKPHENIRVQISHLLKDLLKDVLRENNDLQKVIALMVFADVGDGKLLATIFFPL